MIKVKDEAKEVLGQPGIPLSAAQRLTEKRTLAAPPGTRLTKRRILAVLELAKCVFP